MSPPKSNDSNSQSSNPAAPSSQFGEFFTEPNPAAAAAAGVPGDGSSASRGNGSGSAVRGSAAPNNFGRTGQASSAAPSPNMGLQRRSDRRRVIGGETSIRAVGAAVRKSYNVAGGIQFNDVEELRGDAISRAYAQEILEKLWATWGLDTGSAETMRKAEDFVHALFAMRTASPDADYSVYALIGGSEVNLQDLSDILFSEEVTRRRFARAISDDIREYVSHPENVRLREMLTTELGVKAEYATLAFDGSTHCSGMSTNQMMFTKQLERMNLFDTAEVRDRLNSSQMLSTGQFQVNRGRGAYTN